MQMAWNRKRSRRLVNTQRASSRGVSSADKTEGKNNCCRKGHSGFQRWAIVVLQVFGAKRPIRQDKNNSLSTTPPWLQRETDKLLEFQTGKNSQEFHWPTRCHKYGWSSFDFWPASQSHCHQKGRVVCHAENNWSWKNTLYLCSGLNSIGRKASTNGDL